MANYEDTGGDLFVGHCEMVGVGVEGGVWYGGRGCGVGGGEDLLLWLRWRGRPIEDQ